MSANQAKPLLITIPHSGEKVPVESPWLKDLPEPLLMCDVDRFVDVLYEDTLKELHLKTVKTDWHRYAIDLNRWRDDVDRDSVIDHANPSGKFPRGLHWRITTKGETLMPKAIEKDLHDVLVKKYFEPFHTEVRAALQELKNSGSKTVYHIDLHSMPSLGTKEHRDPGELRADIVISDNEGKSCNPEFLKIVTDAYTRAGFSTSYNWPYKGGRVTETYGRPKAGVESIQVELNRGLYMDEETKHLRKDLSEKLKPRLKQAINDIYTAL